MVEVWAGHALNRNETGRPLLNPPNGVVDQGEVARHRRVKFNHGSPPCRDEGGLQAPGRRANEVSLPPHLVHNGANHVEGGDEVRPAITKKETNSIPSLGLERAITLEEVRGGLGEGGGGTLRAPTRPLKTT